MPSPKKKTPKTATSKTKQYSRKEITTLKKKYFRGDKLSATEKKILVENGTMKPDKKK